MNLPPESNATGDCRDRRLISCFRHAFGGIFCALRTQRNIRIHLGVSAGVIALGLWLGLSWTEWAILVLTMALVLVAELFNSALEATIDLATETYHPLAKAGKDMAAGAVLLAAICSVIIGLLILGPRLMARLANWF